jgi:histidyl-tRNA synthetase
VFFGKPSKALDYANSYGIKKVLFIGKKEIEQKKFKIKDMKTGKEVLLTIEKIKKSL